MSFKCAPASRKAAEYATTHWHYSESMPAGRLSVYGIWEHDKYIGAIVYGHGGAPQIHMPFGVEHHQACELVRIALAKHDAPVSSFLAMSLRLLRKRMPNMRVIVSYADMDQNHHGGIYQATNWIYMGSITKDLYIIHGKKVHSRNVEQKYKGKTPLLPYLRKYVDPKAAKIKTPPKHKYVMPLDNDTRLMLTNLAKPYPKRATSIDGDAVAFQAAEGGSIPTVALQSTDSPRKGIEKGQDA